MSTVNENEPKLEEEQQKNNGLNLQQIENGTEKQIKLVETDRVISVNYVIRQKDGKTLNDKIDLNKLSDDYKLMPLCITGIESPKIISDLITEEDKYNKKDFVPIDINNAITDVNNIFTLGGTNKRKNTPYKRTRKNTRRYRR